ncbi:tetraacyldisaccharide 4'-kinase [Sulfurirhabdus autotrophica]|nr:tetraacyldisaccharide 4'-kinase [Sulfurirhabdus autotrophica]
MPFSLVFWLLSGLRRVMYRVKLLRSYRVPVPVIVVGNISVGGTGKTPCVLWLVKYLQQQGWQPGIISRGYGGHVTRPLAVMPQGNPVELGDEPVLLARRSGCPVWVGRDRVAAAQALLESHPDCNVLVSDDGLQHYRLVRDVELAVVDGARLFGNRMLLPSGPLRESVSRLNTVDAVVVNQSETATGQIATNGQEFSMQLQGQVLYNLSHPAEQIDVKSLQGKQLHAVAGIGYPERFFTHLRQLGLLFEAHSFPDHYVYEKDDLCFQNSDAILMTEKDAVKCAGLGLENAWVLAVDAIIDPALGVKIIEKLRK